MSNFVLWLWDAAVALGIFGWGTTSLHLLGFRRRPLALSGMVGVSLWIAAGGWLNLLHLLRPSVFFVMAGTGILLGVFELRPALRRPGAARTPIMPSNLLGKLMLGAGMAFIGLLLLGSLNPRVWNGDDAQGYVPLAVKAAQMHSIQPDPFCERRVQAGVGGATFLDALMFASGDVRSMTFVDSVFGLLLYALSIWDIGRLWNVSSGRIGLVLFCLPLATLMQVNISIVYLSAAGFLVVLYLLSDPELDNGFRIGRVVALGVIGGALFTTKSPNIVFLVPLLVLMAGLAKLYRPRAWIVLPLAGSLLIAMGIVLPYAIANKTNAGTFLYPLLGLGFHVNAYHLIRPASALVSWAQLTVVLVPGLIFFLLSIPIVAKLTERWDVSPRVAVMAYLTAAPLAMLITAYGTGGEAGDRYTAPFLMPTLLLVLLIVLGTYEAGPRLWTRLGTLTLALAGFYIFFFIGYELDWYSSLDILAHQVVDSLPTKIPPWVYPCDRTHIEAELARGARIQAALPPHAVAIEAMQTPYGFDFRRDTIYIADFPGLASPPPGMPLRGTATDLRQYLLSCGIHYIIVDKRIQAIGDYLRTTTFTESLPDFLKQQKAPIAWQVYFSHPGFAHKYGPWARVEMYIAIRERTQMYQIVMASPQVYNDGTIIVGRLQ